ncbi:hypothetical protein SAMN04489812_5067 [Microlunatus soli]|uniref:ASCH domain-containing protein n=2 Tax=Microlunatus soli TaxID=630515 RepID=A0A1H1Z8S6_9ACTN|nr:hypothetical protein SAMN04489812_5067 [Microlunatus soli]
MVLFSNADLERIVSGEVDLAFRSWKRPMHAVGGRQRTHAGVVEFTAIDRVELDEITESDAGRAGTDLARLRRFLTTKPGEIYRIGVRYAGPDERAALRDRSPDGAELDEIVERLRTMDGRSRHGAWTRQHLSLIDRHPGELAETLATSIGRDKLPFKADIRRLKELGLTESLRVGYRLSPRGRAVLARLRLTASDAGWTPG